MSSVTLEEYGQRRLREGRGPEEVLLAGKLLLEMQVLRPHSGPQKIGAGTLEPTFYQALQVIL